METIFVPSRTLCLSLEVGIFGLQTEANWSQKRCHGNSPKGVIWVFFVMDIYGSKFQEHCFNISRDIVYSVFTTFQLQYYDIITDLIYIIKNVNFSRTKKDISKRKTPFFRILKGLSNKQKKFLVSCTL